MPPITTYANYSITFADQAEYEFAVTAAGGNIYDAAPFSAAAFFGIPWPPPSGDLNQIPRTLLGYTPYGVAITPVEVLNPNPSGVFMQNNVDQVFVPGQAGNPASIFPAGDGMIVKWTGVIVRHNGENGIPDPGDIAAIPQRRWITGFEICGSNAEGSGSNTINPWSRDASRTFDGIGMAVRGGNLTGTSFTRLLSEMNPSLVTFENWERFYIRLRAVPSTDFPLWRCAGTPNSGQGQKVKILPSQSLGIYSQTGSEVLQGTVSIPNLNQWYRIDMIYQYRQGATPGRFRLWIDGDLQFDQTQPSGTGLFANQQYISSTLVEGGTAETTIILDIDDWICAAVPRDGGGAELLNSIDFLMGSHCRAQYAVSGTAVNWTPVAPQLMNQGISNVISTNNVLVSTTSGAAINLVTDVTNNPNNSGLPVGHVCAQIGVRVLNASGTDGQAGYSLAGGASVMTTIDENGITGTRIVQYKPSGMFFPDDIVPFGLHRTKSLDANSTSTFLLQSLVEAIGTWGQEDDPLFPVEINRNGWLHNCQYSNTIWSQPFGIPNSPAAAVGGTYTGNGTEQNINLPLPCHLLIIRALTGGSQITYWMGANLGGHRGGNIGVSQNTPIRVWCDDLGQAKFTVAGSDVNTNANAVTYQYIAFCDPGMRFFLCGAYVNIPTVTSNPFALQSADFNPIAGFFQIELVHSGTSGSRFYYKSPDHATNAASNISGTQQSNFAAFGAGVLDLRTDVNSLQQSQTSFGLWKGPDDCSQIMLQFTTYTGNATSPRTINLSPTTSRFPLFVMVIPRTTSSGFIRDPSHTGVNSADIVSGANSTIAITGVGMDSITVNTSLNANGVVYDVFAIAGDTASMANGIYIPTNCTAPPDAWGDPEPGDAPDIAILGEGGLILGGVSPLTILKDVSGIYTVVTGKHDDTLYDRQSGQPSVDVKIPDPTFKTGYIGG